MELPLAGNLTDQPVFVGDESKARMSFTLAVNESYRDPQGQWQSGETMYWKCWAWNKRAVAIKNAGFVKGSPVVVHGQVRANVWQDADGTKHRSNVIDVKAMGPDVTKPVPATVADRHNTLNVTGEDRTDAWDTPTATGQEAPNA